MTRRVHGPMFDPPIARGTDPLTSHKAAARLTTRASHSRIILEVVSSHPGKTCREIASLAGLEPYEVSKRLSDLRSRRLIHPVGERLCRFSDRSARTWEATT